MKLKKTQITLIILPLTACAMLKPIENLLITKIKLETEKIQCKRDVNYPKNPVGKSLINPPASTNETTIQQPLCVVE